MSHYGKTVTVNFIEGFDGAIRKECVAMKIKLASTHKYCYHGCHL